MQALKELGDISREDVRALRERHREAFMGVLTGEQHRQQMSALKASEEVGREQVRALRAQYPEAFKAVLTEEQREQLEELRAERESQGELRRSGRRGKPSAGQFTRQTILTQGGRPPIGRDRGPANNA